MSPERHVVAAEQAGERLDVFLAAFAGSRSAASRLIDGGLVTVDGQRKPKRHAVSAGEVVDVAAGPPRLRNKAVIARFEVAYEDEHLIVVDKPPGVVVHPARGNSHGTLVQALEGRVAGGPDPYRPGVVHRLDRDTSGLLVLARSQAAYEGLTAMIAARAMEREYLALVEGRPPARSGTIDAPLGRDRRVRTRASTDTDEPRHAITHFTLERALPAASLLRLRLDTGRTHQIRAHLRAIGHPVAGDPEYGTPGLFGLERQFLHSTRLGFSHPLTGVAVSVESPLPADLREALELASAST